MRNICRIICLGVLLFGGTGGVQLALAQEATERFQEVQIYFADRQEVARLAEAGVILDHAGYARAPSGGFYLTTILSEAEVRRLAAANFSYRVLIDDVVQYYQSRPPLTPEERRRFRRESGLAGFEFGSMGGFYTYAEVITELDSMRLLYPHLITARQSIGFSHEGRPIWMVKISDNPDLSEPEPQVLYDALHHAREPMSMMTLMYFMYYLLENYGVDPEVTYLVDHRELYFVPVVNPDGYVYNEQIQPAGGGMWRKNRRNNGDGTWGVDPNRNYGYMWGYDNIGSSPDPGDDTYRGPFAFSEPENQAMRNLCLTHNFQLALNYHSFGNLLIYPWGYRPNFLTPDSMTYMAYAAEMTRRNGYIFGTGDQTVGYVTNGDSDDWMYGEQTTKNKILAMTPEVGSAGDGFWPAQNRIYPLAQENLYPNLFAAWVAGGLVTLLDYAYRDVGNGNGFIDPGETVRMAFRVKNIGQGEAANVTFSLASEDPLIHLDSMVTHGPVTLPAQAEAYTDTFTFTVDPNAQTAYMPELHFTISIDGVRRSQIVSDLIVGTPFIALFDDAENGPLGWDTGQGWNATTQTAHSGALSFTDSPQGNYSRNANNALTLLSPLDLSNARAAFLEFWTRWNIETTYDFAQVEISTDGMNWTALAGRYTVPGSGNGVQPPGEPGYEGFQGIWVKEFMDLSSYIGAPQVYLRFTLRSDAFEERDGWYLDDIRVSLYRDVIVGSE
ncbi:MAG: hypothetical protein D6681_01485, partial [Calditrichaeota bacterium]